MQKTASGNYLPILSRQKLLVMKLLMIFTFAACLHASANISAQTVSIKVSNSSLVDVLKEVKRQTKVDYFLTGHQAEIAKPITINASQKPLAEFLKECFQGQPLTYQLTDNSIIVREKSTTIAPSVNVITEAAAVIDVKGVVKDETGKPAAGVAVRVKGTNKGTTTHENGEFSIIGVNDNATLVFSSINLQTFEVKVSQGNNTNITITLKAKVNELADVSITSVNTGYQSVSKERFVGSYQ